MARIEEAKVRVGTKLAFANGDVGQITAVSTHLISVRGDIVTTARVNYRRYSQEGTLVLVKTDVPAQAVFPFLKRKREAE